MFKPRLVSYTMGQEQYQLLCEHTIHLTTDQLMYSSKLTDVKWKCIVRSLPEGNIVGPIMCPRCDNIVGPWWDNLIRGKDGLASEAP